MKNKLLVSGLLIAAIAMGMVSAVMADIVITVKMPYFGKGGYANRSVNFGSWVPVSMVDDGAGLTGTVTVPTGGNVRGNLDVGGGGPWGDYKIVADGNNQITFSEMNSKSLIFDSNTNTVTLGRDITVEVPIGYGANYKGSNDKPVQSNNSPWWTITLQNGVGTVRIAPNATSAKDYKVVAKGPSADYPVTISVSKTGLTMTPATGWALAGQTLSFGPVISFETPKVTPAIGVSVNSPDNWLLPSPVPLINGAGSGRFVGRYRVNAEASDASSWADINVGIDGTVAITDAGVNGSNPAASYWNVVGQTLTFGTEVTVSGTRDFNCSIAAFNSGPTWNIYDGLGYYPSGSSNDGVGTERLAGTWYVSGQSTYTTYDYAEIAVAPDGTVSKSSTPPPSITDFGYWNTDGTSLNYGYGITARAPAGTELNYRALDWWFSWTSPVILADEGDGVGSTQLPLAGDYRIQAYRSSLLGYIYAIADFKVNADGTISDIVPVHFNGEKGSWRLVETDTIEIVLAVPVKAYLTPKSLNVDRKAEHSFVIQVSPTEVMDVIVGDSAEIKVNGVEYSAIVSDVEYGISIKVYMGDALVDNDPTVELLSINGTSVEDAKGGTVTMTLNTFSNRDGSKGSNN